MATACIGEPAFGGGPWCWCDGIRRNRTVIFLSTSFCLMIFEYHGELAEWQQQHASTSSFVLTVSTSLIHWPLSLSWYILETERSPPPVFSDLGGLEMAFSYHYLPELDSTSKPLNWRSFELGQYLLRIKRVVRLALYVELWPRRRWKVPWWDWKGSDRISAFWYGLILTGRSCLFVFLPKWKHLCCPFPSRIIVQFY